MSRVSRVFLRLVMAALVVLALPAATASAFALSTFDALYAPGPERPIPAVAAAAHDPAKPTAVVVVGDRGAEVADVLAPFEVLAATGAFNVYTVAPQRRPVALTGGLDLVPDLTFDELADRLGAAAPDLVVIPAMPDEGEPSTAPVTGWLRAQAARGAQLLSVCNGAGLLASAGLLDGRPATTHWIRITSYERRYPQVGWVRGQRFVDAGQVVTTAGILSSIDGTLHMIERMIGPAAAAGAAQAVGWRYYRLDRPVIVGSGVPDPVAIVNAGFRIDPPRIGVLLTDGVGELELASVFDVHGGQSLAARTLALSADGAPVRSRHGLTFVPRAAAGASGELDRLLVPGAAAAAAGVAPVPGAPALVYLHERPGFAFEPALTDLARSTDVATARWTAKVLELPTDRLVLRGQAWPWLPTLFAATLAGIGAIGGVGVLRWVSRSGPQ